MEVEKRTEHHLEVLILACILIYAVTYVGNAPDLLIMRAVDCLGVFFQVLLDKCCRCS